MRIRRLLAGAVLSAVSALGCGGADSAGLGPSKADVNPYLIITPTSARGYLGTDLKFSWSVHDSAAAGADITSKYPAFAFDALDLNIVVPQSDPSSPTGDAWCVHRGVTQVRAKLVGVANQAPAIANVTCDSVAVSSSAPSGSAPVQLKAADATSGAAVNNTTFAWTSTNAAVAPVTPAGVATPLSPGYTVVSVTQVVKGTTYPVASGQFYVTGPGSCSLNPTGDHTKSVTVRVQSDPGNHAGAIAMPATLPVLDLSFSGAFNENFHAQVTASSVAPFVNVFGGWVGADCAFVANGMGTVAGQANVGVRLTGVWTNGALNLTYTVGTNGELSGGPTVYSISG